MKALTLTEATLDRTYSDSGRNVKIEQVIKTESERLSKELNLDGFLEKRKLRKMVEKFYEEFGTRASMITNNPDRLDQLRIRVNRHEEEDGIEFRYDPRSERFINDW